MNPQEERTKPPTAKPSYRTVLNTIVKTSDKSYTPDGNYETTTPTVSFDCGHPSSITPPGAQVPQHFPHSCQSCAFTEAECRERQITEESNDLIRRERDAEIEGKRLLKMEGGRNDMVLATEVARAGAEVTRLMRIRDQKLLGVWKEWKDVWESNNRGC